MENLFGINLPSNFLVVVSIVLSAFIYWIIRRQDYFKNKNVPYAKSIPLLGSFTDAIFKKASFYDNILSICNQPSVKNKPFFGFFLFHKPTLMVQDPEIIKKILVKDFQSFNDRYTATDVHDDLGYHQLFSLKNPLWKKMRGKLSPFFTSGKLKTMYYILDKLSNDLLVHIEKKLNKSGKVELELKDLAALFSTDVIANCAFGVDAKSLENPNAEFRKIGRSIFELSFWRSLEFMSAFMLPQISKLFGFTIFTKKGSKFIKETITDVISERKKSGNKRNDLIDTLIELKEGANPIEDEVAMAQAAFFFTAGYETSSATNSFALYELTKNKDMQDRVRNEIREMLQKTGGKVTYDSIMNTTEMPYLHQVINETLRRYPILPLLDRVCTNPNGFSLEPVSDFRIPQGMPIYIPIYATHLDERNFSDPLKFDPERFSPENVGHIKPFTFFPFGTGPRNCIGERFGLMQVKTGIVKVLKEFRLEPSPQTPSEVIIDKNAFVLQSEKPLIVNFVKDPLI